VNGQPSIIVIALSFTDYCFPGLLFVGGAAVPDARVLARRNRVPAWGQQSAMWQNNEQSNKAMNLSKRVRIKGWRPSLFIFSNSRFAGYGRR